MGVWYHRQHHPMNPLQALIKKTLKEEGRKPSTSQGEDAFALHCKARLPFKPFRQFKFHLTRKWTFDFAWPVPKIAVEIEGGVWVRGRHNRGAGYEKDCEKYNAATKTGWKVYRFTTAQVTSGEAIDFMTPILK